MGFTFIAETAPKVASDSLQRDYDHVQCKYFYTEIAALLPNQIRYIIYQNLCSIKRKELPGKAKRVGNKELVMDK